MKHFNTCIWVAVATFAIAGRALGQDVQIVDIIQGDADVSDKLETITMARDMGLGILTYIIGPFLGMAACYSGWRLMGSADNPRDKKSGALVFASGVGFFALGTVIQEILVYMGF